MTTNAPSEVTSPVIRGVATAAPAARRAQRIAALAVFLIPSVGVAVGVWQILEGRVRSGALVLLAILYVLTSLGVTMGYHRHFAHKSFETSPGMQFVLVLLGSMAAQGPLLFWVATHRRHHAYSDRPGDPHSPHLTSGPLARLRGFAHAHMGWMLSDQVTSWPVFARDLMRSNYVYWLHRIYWPALATGLLLPTAIGALLWGGLAGALDGLVWGGLIRIWLLNQASWCVGSISHMFGSRPFTTRDQSANNWFVAVLTGGEGLQNNHHAFPSSAIHGLHWWEPDLTGLVIRICARLGLVWKVNTPSAHALDYGRAGGELCHFGRIEDVPPQPETYSRAESSKAARGLLARSRSEAVLDGLLSVRLGLSRSSRAAGARLVRAAMGGLSRVAPGLAARVALSMFLTPPRARAADTHRTPRVGPGTPLSISYRGTKLMGRKWGDGPAVLLMHGWGTDHSHLTGFVDPLVEANFSVIAFDGPAHGAAAERHADAMDFATAVDAAWRGFGPFHAMVGHSLGAAALLIATRHFGLRPKKLVIVSSPASLVCMTNDFAGRLGISDAVTAKMRSLMTARSGISWQDASIESIVETLETATLFVHDVSDTVVPYTHCQQLAARARNGRVLPTRGRGHTGTVWDRNAISAIVEFSREPVEPELGKDVPQSSGALLRNLSPNTSEQP